VLTGHDTISGRFVLRDLPHTLDEAGRTADVSVQLLGGDAERGEDNYFMAAVNLDQVPLPATGVDNNTTAEDLEINVCIWVDVNGVVNVTATVLPEWVHNLPRLDRPCMS
jgi:hypothetical protein